MRALISLLLMAAAPLVQAQGRTCTLQTDSGQVRLHFFSTGELSTLDWIVKGQERDRSWAFKRDGTVLLAYETRRHAWHIGVRYTYHASGAVASVEYSTAPEGSGPWYRSYTGFDPEGNRNRFVERGNKEADLLSHPDSALRPGPGEVWHPERPIAECQKLYVSEVFLVNGTDQACRAVVSPVYEHPTLPRGTHFLDPSDTVRLGTYAYYEAFVPPDRQLTFFIEQVGPDAKKRRVPETRTDAEMVGPEHVRYVIRITGWKKGRNDQFKREDGITPLPRGGSKWWMIWG
jgi:hypothetical protein